MAGKKGMKHGLTGKSPQWIGTKLKEKMVKDKLEYLGQEALFHVITSRCQFTKVLEALILLRDGYILEKYHHEKTYQANVYPAKIGQASGSYRRSVQRQH